MQSDRSKLNLAPEGTGVAPRAHGAQPPLADTIDHVVVGVRELSQAAAQWRRLGFTLTPRGRHFGWGTANHCVMFLHSYIELLGIVDPTQFTNGLVDFLAKREGLLSLAFGTSDADAATARLRSSGIAAETPRTLARYLEVGEGDAVPEFRVVMLPAVATPGISAFVCQNLSPDLVRFPAWLTHPNGAVSLKSILAVVDDPFALALPYQRLFGADALTGGEGVLHVRVGQATLSFATAHAAAGLQPGANFPAVRTPFLAAITVGVVRLEETAQYFDDFGVPFTTANGSIRLDPKEASGVIVAFEAAGL